LKNGEKQSGCQETGAEDSSSVKNDLIQRKKNGKPTKTSIKVVFDERPKDITSEITLYTNNGRQKKCIALWDTGTQEYIIISKSVRKELGLEYEGENTINGIVCHYCTVNIDINGWIIQNAKVLVHYLDDIGYDVIIGMDIIADGDFRIRKRDSREWVFTFNN
jgi:hypothetical protein